MTLYLSDSPTASWSGETIGIMVLECHYPFIPGNVANARTFQYPVRYAVVEGADVQRLLYQADPTLIEPFVKAAQKLEREGVKAITGACGFMALFQKQLQDAVSIPVFASSLLQISFMHAITNKKVGIITADSRCLKPEHFDSVGVQPNLPIATIGMENEPAFVECILEGRIALDDDKVRHAVLSNAKALTQQHKDIGSILLECSDLPPYGKDIQEATGLPVFDFITMIDFVHSSLLKRNFSVL
ncbi:hypothetical protein SOPP22_07220 [Shewanella sp. OPT22]|nr:hypothetical protein SOPP22_07220 [Shewanella sp. OPT22]